MNGTTFIVKNRLKMTYKLKTNMIIPKAKVRYNPTAYKTYLSKCIFEM